MVARQIIVAGAMPSRDVNGRSLPARFRFYLPSSGGVPATVFADSALTVAHPFPIISGSDGRWPQIWAEENTYFDVAWSDLATDSAIYTFKDVRPLDDGLYVAAVLADGAAEQAQAAAAAAEQTLADTEAAVAALGDFSEAAATSVAAAAIAAAARDDAAAYAAAAAASAASIDTNRILVLARAYGIAAASLN